MSYENRTPDRWRETLSQKRVMTVRRLIGFGVLGYAVALAAALGLLYVAVRVVKAAWGHP